MQIHVKLQRYMQNKNPSLYCSSQVSHALAHIHIMLCLAFNEHGKCPTYCWLIGKNVPLCTFQQNCPPKNVPRYINFTAALAEITTSVSKTVISFYTNYDCRSRFFQVFFTQFLTQYFVTLKHVQHSLTRKLKHFDVFIT